MTGVANLANVFVAIAMFTCVDAAESYLIQEDETATMGIVNKVYFTKDLPENASLHIVRRYPICNGPSLSNDMTHAIFGIMHYGIVGHDLMSPSSDDIKAAINQDVMNMITGESDRTKMTILENIRVGVWRDYSKASGGIANEDFSPSIFTDGNSLDDAMKKVAEFAVGRDLEYSYRHDQIQYEKLRESLRRDIPLIVVDGSKFVPCIGFIEIDNAKYIVGIDRAAASASELIIEDGRRQKVVPGPLVFTQPSYWCSCYRLLRVKTQLLDCVYIGGWIRNIQKLSLRIPSVLPTAIREAKEKEARLKNR